MTALRGFARRHTLESYVERGKAEVLAQSRSIIVAGG